MGRLRAVLALALVLCALPGVAAASTVTVDPVARFGHGVAVFTGGAEPNDVSMGFRGAPFGSVPPFTGEALWVVDAAQTLDAGAGCVAGLPVWCQALIAEVNLDGGDDRFGPGFLPDFVTVHGGAGKDHIQANGLSNWIYGDSGADWLNVGGNVIGHGYGGSGDDDIRSHASSSTDLNGGSGDDLVYGERPNHNGVSGGSGDDYLIIGTRSASPSSATVRGGHGEDVLLMYALGSAEGELSGGDGDDTIVGGRGSEAVSGDGGEDVIDVSGDARSPDAFEQPDSVVCGPGTDTVYADADDVVAADCENRLDGPMPPNERVGAALARLADAFGVTTAG